MDCEKFGVYPGFWVGLSHFAYDLFTCAVIYIIVIFSSDVNRYVILFCLNDEYCVIVQLHTDVSPVLVPKFYVTGSHFFFFESTNRIENQLILAVLLELALLTVKIFDICNCD